MNRQLIDRFRFFLKHSGYSTPPGRAACALSLARAEHIAQDIVDASFEWENDSDQPIEDLLDPSIFKSETEFKAYCDKYRDDVTSCVLRHANGEVRASLCGIIDADSSYRRVVEAELALEAFAQEFFL